MTTKEQASDFLKILEYAAKAPSGHNTQPWKFKISENGIEVHPDFNRELPIVDGNHRELYISLGCAVENICIAADEFGYSYEAKIAQLDNSYFIRVSLQKALVRPNPLFAQIDKRQTNRSIYKSKTIADDTIALLEAVEIKPPVSVYFFKKEDKDFTALADFVYRGNEIQYSNKAFKEELLEWMRFNSGEAKQYRDGLAYSTLGVPSLPRWLGKLIVGTFLNPSAQNRSEKRKLASSSHLVLFTTKENSPENWILAGRALEHFLLKCTSLGIAAAFSNQPCEESKLSAEIREQIPINNEYPMLLLRIGYADPMPYSSRKKLSDLM